MASLTSRIHHINVHDFGVVLQITIDDPVQDTEWTCSALFGPDNVDLTWLYRPMPRRAFGGLAQDMHYQLVQRLPDLPVGTRTLVLNEVIAARLRGVPVPETFDPDSDLSRHIP